MNENNKLIRKMKKEIKGITLIALVVTIVVLLILSAVAIGLSIGDNGIITSARNATEQWEQGAANEQDELKQIADFINSNNGNSEEDDIIGLNDVPIPKGFYYVGGTKTDGIVISDNPADENKYKEQTEAGNSQIPGDGLVGNQFVWVPVENPADFKRYPSDASSSLDGYVEPQDDNLSIISDEKKEYDLMCQSVIENHGFYVARYEAGSGGLELGTVSQKGYYPVRFISWEGAVDTARF